MADFAEMFGSDVESNDDSDDESNNEEANKGTNDEVTREEPDEHSAEEANDEPIGAPNDASNDGSNDASNDGSNDEQNDKPIDKMNEDSNDGSNDELIVKKSAEKSKPIIESGDESNEGIDQMPKTPGEAFVEDEEQMDIERVGDEEEEAPEEPEPVPETRIDVEIPRIVADLGSEVHFVKLPNFLSIDTHPYDPQWYEDEIDEDENLDDEGRARLKLKVENTIRWRNVVDRETNELKKQSNSRVVRWSDGTYSLYLGEEIFDIHRLNLMAGDNNHLFIRQGTGLQGQTVFRTKLTFRPYSTESFTHRKLTLSLADRSQKTQKIRVLPNVGKDPEARRSEMIKKEEDRLKASIRRENKQRRARERSLIRGPTASYLEPDGDEDDDEEGISIARIKDRFKRGSYSKYADDGDVSADESKAEKEDIEDDDDSDLDFRNEKKERKKAVVEDSDDD
ncbi:unnamed protein product [Medioppia subpectinata]|uniref:RNA polymerase-associated protein LEO1 n=1 Tax=Medioppia subpectinata TaxID=1979941 RepID=A0A7R9Q142_9ACAR|nr:unnamed protein product [Medioppia subpectinata]CAG2108169.1 unnamed protein product [Medioppia subpectinata]